jgi:hypothetical protein
MQMLHQQQKAAGQMQRDPSDMDGNRTRPADSGEADNAPSPSKRPRLDGGAPFNPNQGVMMPNGRPGQGMPGQQQVGDAPDLAQTLLRQNLIKPTSLNPDQLQAFASAAPQMQAKIASYSTNMSQHHGNQMPNKPMPNAPGPQGQGSPMVPQGPDGNSLTQYYNPGDLGPGNMRPGAPNGQATTGSNHALQDYQMQLMLLEQQNKKRLMMARQEQDLTTNNMPRSDGPGGPGAPPGPNAQFQGTSPPGGRSGASPNPSEQMKRASQQMANAANMGSPLPDGAQSRSSPGAMNFMGGNMDPNAGQHFGMNMSVANQMNGAMRPPSSHPPFNGQMNQQQMLAAQRQQPGGPGAPMQWPQGGPNGQMPGQPPQPQGPGGPAPNQRSMPPPSAPATAVAAANARNATASPQVSNAAPPTPQQANKAAPKKKETKSAKAKVSFPPPCSLMKAQRLTYLSAGCRAEEEQPEPQQRCGHARCRTNRGAARGPDARDPDDARQPSSLRQEPGREPQPGCAERTASGADAPATTGSCSTARSHRSQPAHQLLGSWVNRKLPCRLVHFISTADLYDQDFHLDFASNPLQTDNVLDGFDFDSFLQDGNNGEEPTFDFNAGFSMEPDTTIGATE